jgi:Hypervirulence associated proteins TUDOR domain
VPNEFKEGDKVQWESAQGTIKGVVEKKLTQPIDIEGHHVAASKDNPEYLVKSDKTGKTAARKPESLQAREN